LGEVTGHVHVRNTHPMASGNNARDLRKPGDRKQEQDTLHESPFLMTSGNRNARDLRRV
jgi:hypothetical protein